MQWAAELGQNDPNAPPANHTHSDAKASFARRRAGGRAPGLYYLSAFSPLHRSHAARTAAMAASREPACPLIGCGPL